MNQQEFYDALLDRVGFVDGAEVTADGSAGNDLAHERVDAVLDFIQLVKQSPWPKGLVPDFAPGRWYRSIDRDGRLWTESSDPDEVIKHAKAGCRLERSYRAEQVEWRPWYEGAAAVNARLEEEV